MGTIIDDKEKTYSIEESYKAIKEIEKNTNMPKIFCGIIMSNHGMYCLPQFMKGLKNIDYPNMEVMIVDNSADDQAQNFCRSIRELGYTVIHLDRVKYTRENLTNSRNYLADYFVKHNKENPDDQFEYFFSLESDVIPSPNIIQQLLKNQVSCVSGVYMNGKVYPPKQQGGHELHTWIPMAWQYPEDGIPELNVLRPMDLLKDIVPSRLQRVQSTGLGCLLIKRHVLEKVHKLNKGKTFKVELDSAACDDMFWHTDITKVCGNPDCGYVNDNYIHKCPECGNKCVWAYLDSSVFCRHLHNEWNSELRKFR